MGAARATARSFAVLVAVAVGASLLLPVRPAGAEEPTICSGGSLTGDFVRSRSPRLIGNDRGTVWVASGQQVRVVGSVTNRSGSLQPVTWRLDPFIGWTTTGGTASRDVMWTNTGASRLVEVRFEENPQNPFHSDSYRFSFSFAVTGAQTFGCQLAANGGPVTPDQVLGGSHSASFRHSGCAQGQATGHPVSTSTGNFWHRFADLAIPGRGVPLALGRTYNAHPGTTVPDGPLGHGWSFTYGLRLAVGASSVTVTEEGGNKVVFSGAGPTYTTPGRFAATLVRDVPAAGMFSLTRQRQEVSEFDASGRLVAQRDLNGNGIVASYSGADLTSVSEDRPGGRTLSFTWTGAAATRHLKAVTDANEPSRPARTVTFSYGPGDTGADLTQVLDVSGGTTQFAYDTDHRMTRMRMPAQHKAGVAITADSEVVANVYDAQGRVASQTDPTGATTAFDYTTVPGSTIVTEAATTDPAGNPVAHARLDTYANGLLSAQTLGYGSPGASTWLREYDPATLGCTKVTDPNGHQWLASFDGFGNRTSATDPLGHTTRWSYNARNLVVTMIDPRATGLAPEDLARWTTTYEYDDGGCACNLQRRTRPLLNPAGTAVVDNEVVELRYGERGNEASDLTTVVDPDGFGWQRDYDDAGNLERTVDPPTPENPAGNTTAYDHDQRGNLASVTSPRGVLTAAPDDFTSTFAYDDAGRRTRARDPRWDPASPTEHQSTWAYDGNANLEATTDGNGHTTSYEHDAADRLRFVTRPDTTRTETRWWPGGALREQRDAAQAAAGQPGTRYFPDSQGRLATVIDPLGRARTHGYDPAGNRMTTTDPGGDCGASPKVGCTSFAYDDADRLVGIDYSDAATPDVTSVGYDAGGRRIAMADGTGASSWSYDSLGRLAASTRSGATVTYGRNRRGLVTTLGYPLAAPEGTVTRSYDGAGRLASVTDWVGEASFGYDPDANLITQSLPNGVVTTTVADEAGAAHSITHARGGATVAGFAYAYDAKGQVETVSPQGVPGGPETYGYSPLDQLATRNGSAEWAYDAADNLARLGAGHQGFDAARQLCFTATSPGGTCASPPAGATTYGHDARGNRTSATPAFGTASGYAYDQADRLVAAERSDASRSAAVGWYHSLVARSDGTVAAFGYNASGQLGTGTNADATSPTTVPGLSGVVSVAGGAFHSLALRADGTVWGFGSNWLGQLGNASTVDANVPTKVAGLSRVVAISAGAYHSLALRADGSVWAWGFNGYGQLGTGSTADSAVPVQVQGLSGVAQVSAGAFHSLARKADGSVRAWGHNGYGQLGDGSTADAHTPVQVQGVSAVAALSSGHHHSLALRDDGTVWSWGYNAYGQLGTNSTTNSPTPVQPAGLSNVVSVAAGGYGSAVVKDDQSVATWGSNAYGSLGLGSTTDALVPTAVSGLTSVAGLSPGAVTSLALRADGSVWAWGNNNTGAVGDGTTTTPRTSPQAVPDLNRGSAPLATYAYGGDGLRASKTVAGQTRAMAWDESAGLPLLVSDGERSYLYGAGGTPYAQVDAAGTVTYLHADHLGSVRALTDAAGATVGTATFDPYGTLSGATGAATTPFGFAGEYTDAETGFVYLRARYYDPATGQFLTRDPLEVISGDSYGYASNNPVNLKDPTGLFPGEGLASGIGDFLTGGDCGDGGLLGDIGDFLSDNADLVHFAINLGAGYVGGAAAASLCVGTLGAGCVIFGGMAISMIVGTTAHHGAALALGEDMSPATSLRWTVQSAGAGVTGGLSRAAWGRGLATGGPLRAMEGSPGLRGLLSQPFWGNTVRSRFGGWHGGLGW